MSAESENTTQFKPDVVSKKKMAAFSMGPFIDTTFQIAYNFLVLYYFEVELGLAAALVALSGVIFAIWNMINDPLLGYLTDKPMRWSKKYGMRAPWIIIGGIGVIISFYFIFAIPDFDAKSNPWPLFWYMVIVTCVFDTFYTIFTTHYFGAFANIFRTKDERRKGSTIALLIGFMGQMICVALIIPMTIIYGDPSSYIRFALITCIILTICLIIFIPGMYENEFVKNRYLQIYEFLESQKLPYFKFVKITFKSKNFMILLLAYMLLTIGNYLVMASYFYFLSDVLGAPIETFMIIMSFLIITYIPAIFIWSWIAKKIDHYKIFILGVVIDSIGKMIGFFATSIPELIISNSLNGIGAAAISSIFFSISSDTMDEVNLACGRHVEAGLMGFRNFFNRIAFLCTALLITITHILTGYQAGASSQTPLAILGIRMHTFLYAVISLLIGAFLMLKFYDLAGEKKEQLMVDLKKKGL